MEAQKWLASLEGKIQQWDLPAEEEREQIEKMIASLEKLEELLTRVESTLKMKAELNARITSLVDRLNTIAKPPEVPGKAPARTLESTLTKVIGHARVVSRVLDAVASSLQLSLESAGKLRPKGEREKPERVDKQEQKKEEQMDLQAILQPLGTLVQNVVEEKLKRVRQEEAGP